MLESEGVKIRKQNESEGTSTAASTAASTAGSQSHEGRSKAQIFLILTYAHIDTGFLAGFKGELIKVRNEALAEKEKLVLEAEGQATAMLATAQATAESIDMIAGN